MPSTSTVIGNAGGSAGRGSGLGSWSALRASKCGTISRIDGRQAHSVARWALTEGERFNAHDSTTQRAAKACILLRAIQLAPLTPICRGEQAGNHSGLRARLSTRLESILGLVRR